MSTNRLAEKERIATYASVLLDGALEQGGQATVLQVRDQMETIIRAMRENPKLTDALKNSAYAPEDRNAIARAAFDGVIPALADVLAVMAERGDSDFLSKVYASFGDAIQQRLNVTIVDVTTVVELDDHLREVITKKVAADLGTDVALREHIDPALLGGILISANGKQIDASVLSRLENARGVLKQTVGGEC